MLIPTVQCPYQPPDKCTTTNSQPRRCGSCNTSNIVTLATNTTSAPDGITSAPDGITPAPDGITPAPDGITPGPDGITPAPDGITPHIISRPSDPMDSPPGLSIGKLVAMVVSILVVLLVGIIAMTVAGVFIIFKRRRAKKGNLGDVALTETNIAHGEFSDPKVDDIATAKNTAYISCKKIISNEVEYKEKSINVMKNNKQIVNAAELIEVSHSENYPYYEEIPGPRVDDIMTLENSTEREVISEVEHRENPINITKKDSGYVDAAIITEVKNESGSHLDDAFYEDILGPRVDDIMTLENSAEREVISEVEHRENPIIMMKKDSGYVNAAVITEVKNESGSHLDDAFYEEIPGPRVDDIMTLENSTEREVTSEVEHRENPIIMTKKDSSYANAAVITEVKNESGSHLDDAFYEEIPGPRVDDIMILENSTEREVISEVEHRENPIIMTKKDSGYVNAAVITEVKNESSSHEEIPGPRVDNENSTEREVISEVEHRENPIIMMKKDSGYANTAVITEVKNESGSHLDDAFYEEIPGPRVDDIMILENSTEREVISEVEHRENPIIMMKKDSGYVNAAVITEVKNESGSHSDDAFYEDIPDPRVNNITTLENVAYNQHSIREEMISDEVEYEEEFIIMTQDNAAYNQVIDTGSSVLTEPNMAYGQAFVTCVGHSNDDSIKISENAAYGELTEMLADNIETSENAAYAQHSTES